MILSSTLLYPPSPCEVFKRLFPPSEGETANVGKVENALYLYRAHIFKL
jgi:hypothetical protein